MQCLRAAIAVLLSACLMPAPVPAKSRMKRQAKALHALNRLTFGPRPGDVAAVEAMDVSRWIDLQLHPKKIDDSALEARLADYKAPFMSPRMLMLQFPPRNLIRQALKGSITVPGGREEQVVWESQMAMEEQRHHPQPAQEMEETQPRLAAGLIDLSPQQRYEKLLAMQPGHMREIVRSIPPKLRPAVISGMTPEQRETIVAMLNPRMVVVNETESVRLLEDIYSQRQLQRVMTEFWLNHFNISLRKNEVEAYYLPEFEREVIEPRALGKFEDLLDAVAMSPAMLIYLDNQQSVGPHSPAALRRARGPRNRPPLGINENYGRELMELHTVGVNGGYTQQDVIEAAKVLTGWTVAPPRQGGGFRFERNRHEPGEKIVMGHKIREGGEKEGLELLHILATSPSTAQFISHKLAIRFVSDHPSQALVRRMAKTFLSSHGNIAAVLKTMTRSPEFWSAPEEKIKTPLDYVVSAARAADADISQPYRLVSVLRMMGMPMEGTEQPNGYSMASDAWAGSSELINRMNFALALASNRIPGVTVSIDPLLGQDGAAMTPSEQEARLEQVILHGQASSQVHDALLASLNNTPAQNRAATSFALAGYGGANPFAAGANRRDMRPESMQQEVIAGLLIGSPEFQRR